MSSIIHQSTMTVGQPVPSLDCTQRVVTGKVNVAAQELGSSSSSSLAPLIQSRAGRSEDKGTPGPIRRPMTLARGIHRYHPGTERCFTLVRKSTNRQLSGGKVQVSGKDSASELIVKSDHVVGAATVTGRSSSAAAVDNATTLSSDRTEDK